MDVASFPTKGNLLNAKNSLHLARDGYALIDRKRNILLRELMGLIDAAKDVQNEIDTTFRRAYRALERANMEMGIHNVEDISATVPIEHSVRVRTRSIMGTEIPLISYEATEDVPAYSFYATNESLDKARIEFRKVKELIVKLSMIEISAYRLADSIQKTQKRANALNHITIPKLEALVKSMSDALEEKDREEFTRLKVIKQRQ
ncbi:MAG: V-type ATP synthase subunit D [Eubacteriales bacterium]|nr:V-type ATP synthase subunit D [Eubacteriales bacterium]